MQTCLLTLLFIVTTLCTFGSTDYYFKQISLENGLSQSTVLSALKDHKGYIWLGTKSGLNRYDQNELINFIHNPEDTTSLPGNRITFIAEDNLRNLWISTNKGLARYNRGNSTFHAVKLNNKQIYAGDYLVQDDGILFCGTDALFKYTYATGKIEKLRITIEKPVSTIFNTLLQWDEKRILIGSRWKGLWIYYPEKQEIKKADFYLGEDIMSLFIDSKRQVWISPYGKGVQCFSADGKPVANYNTRNSGLSNDIILDIEEKENQIWLATDGGGISMLDPETGEFTLIEHISGDIYSFPVNSICKLYKDPQDNMWAGTIRGGLIGIKRVFIKTYKDVALNSPYGLSDKTILSLCEDTDQTIWIGTDGGGINRFDPITETFRHYPSTYKEKIVSIVNFNQEELLVSIFSKGVYLFNKTSGKTTPFTLLNDADNIRIFHSGSSVNIVRVSDSHYIFMADNVYIYNPTNKSFRIARLKSDKYLSTSSLQHITTTDTHSFLYNQHNLFMLDHSDNQISPFFSLNKEYGQINTVCEYNGNFWIGTSTGLFHYNPQLGITEKIQTKLFHEVSSLTCDREGRLWIAAQGMLFTYTILQNRFSILDESDGMYPNEFLSKPVLRSRSNELYLGGVMGLVRIKNMPPQETSMMPSIELADVILNGTSIYENIKPDKPRITVPWDYTSLIIKSIAQKEDIFRKKIFRYQISGLNGLQNESYDQSVNLHALAPGEYDILVSSTAKDGSWSKPKCILTVMVTPPWWKNQWMVFSMLLLIFGSVILIAAWIIRRNEERMKWEMKEHEKQAYEEKVRFLINISHELRTPLTLIYAPLKRMLDLQTVNPETNKQLSRIYKQVKQMKNIINMVLDMRKMEVAENVLHLHEQALNQWVQSVADDFRHEFQEQEIELHYDFDEQISNIYFDSKRCETVLSNLLINALKFSNPKTTITLTTTIHNDYVRIAIKDQGIGLKDSDVEKLFSRFYQGENHDQPGTGIGLSYAKTLIDMHHGVIGAFNNENEPGATFYFDLPLRMEMGEVCREKKTLLNDTFGHPAEDMTALDPNVTYDSTILIVEDDPDLRRFLKEVLSEKFGTIYEANNGMDALSIIRQHLPDIIISDIMMPRMNGLQLCKKVKENPEICHIPFILLTAKTDSESMLTSYKTGADIYLAKPFEMDILEARIINLLKSKNSLKARYKKYALNAELEETTLNNVEEQFIIKLNDIINRNLTNTDLDVKFITEEMGMSRATLYSKLKQLVGLGVNDYINKLRISKASHLLIHTEHSIQEISNQCGFSNQRYFSTVFKQATGSTPSKFREEQLSQKEIQSN